MSEIKILNVTTGDSEVSGSSQLWKTFFGPFELLNAGSWLNVWDKDDISGVFCHLVALPFKIGMNRGKDRAVMLCCPWTKRDVESEKCKQLFLYSLTFTFLQNVSTFQEGKKKIIALCRQIEAWWNLLNFLWIWQFLAHLVSTPIQDFLTIVLNMFFSVSIKQLSRMNIFVS